MLLTTLQLRVAPLSILVHVFCTNDEDEIEISDGIVIRR